MQPIIELLKANWQRLLRLFQQSQSPADSFAVKPLEVGPILGAVLTDQATIFCRGGANAPAGTQCYGAIRFCSADNGEGELLTQQGEVFPLNLDDTTGTFDLQGLLPDTEYLYQVGYFFSSSPDGYSWENPDLPAPYQFCTAAQKETSRRTFVFGSCHQHQAAEDNNAEDNNAEDNNAEDNNADDAIFGQILNLAEGRPDLIFMIGDQIYADTKGVDPPYIDTFYGQYRASFSLNNICSLMAQVPTYMMLDDHEVANDWPSQSEPGEDHPFAGEPISDAQAQAAIDAYELYQLSHNRHLRISNSNWYKFSDGCCDFFVMDLRRERTATEMISQGQMNALLQWLGDKGERTKIIASSVPFFPDFVNEGEDRFNLYKDKWSGFSEQRKKIIDCIGDNGIPCVVFLSGDVHCSINAELSIKQNSESAEVSKVISLVSSPFFYPSELPKAFYDFNMDPGQREYSDKYYCELTEATMLSKKSSFAQVTVEGSSLTIKTHAQGFETGIDTPGGVHTQEYTWSPR